MTTFHEFLTSPPYKKEGLPQCKAKLKQGFHHQCQASAYDKNSKFCFFHRMLINQGREIKS